MHACMHVHMGVAVSISPLPKVTKILCQMSAWACALSFSMETPRKGLIQSTFYILVLVNSHESVCMLACLGVGGVTCLYASVHVEARGQPQVRGQLLGS